MANKPRSPSGKPRVHTATRIDPVLKAAAIAAGLCFSAELERAIAAKLKQLKEKGDGC